MKYGMIGLLFVLLLCSGVVTRGEQQPAADPRVAEIETLLAEQAELWNAGDIEGFMRYYWKSEDLTFSSGGTTRRGWRETRQRYLDRYPTPERMGSLVFSQLEIRPLGETATMVLGRWALDREPDAIGGNFTLVLRKMDDRWVIVHDHTSQSPAE